MLRWAAESSSPFVIDSLDSLLFRETLPPLHTLRQRGAYPLWKPVISVLRTFCFCFSPDPEERRSPLRLYGF